MKFLKSAITFKCGNESKEGTPCSYANMKYDQAINHLRRCPHRLIECPNGCSSSKLFGTDLQTHLNTCPNFWKRCQTCRLKVFRHEIDSHSCMSALKKHFVAQREALEMSKKQIGLDIKPKCENGHFLRYQRGRIPYYNGVQQCDVCRLSSMDQFS